jgi:regulator of cell morphogenesis and NO signaling
MIHGDEKLGDLVTANPARARTLEALDLDYCCHGNRSLTDACAAAGRPVAEVIEALTAVDDATPAVSVDWASLPVPDLLDHVVAINHVPLRTEVPRLLPLARKVAEVHGARHPELAGVAADLERMWAELEPHLDEEEATLVPKLAVGGSIDVAALRAEHEEVGGLLDHLREASGGFAVPADGCASYQALYAGLDALDADIRLHIHKENNVILPAVERALAG